MKNGDRVRFNDEGIDALDVTKLRGKRAGTITGIGFKKGSEFFGMAIVVWDGRLLADGVPLKWLEVLPDSPGDA